jgi:hypothetical protein
VADLPCCGQSRKETLYLTLDIGHPKQALHALRFNSSLAFSALCCGFGPRNSGGSSRCWASAVMRLVR